VRRLLFAAFLLTAFSVSVAAGSAPIDWKSLAYYRDARLIVTTDGSWEGAAVVKLPPALRPGGPSVGGFEKLKRNYIWAKKCGAGRERWTFTKEFQVPGAPIEGSLASDSKFSLGYYPSRDMPYGGSKVNPATATRVTVQAAILPPDRFTDPKGLNNRQQVELLACVEGASDPACR
jgi:hypothetical protein